MSFDNADLQDSQRDEMKSGPMLVDGPKMTTSSGARDGSTFRDVPEERGC